MSDDFTCDRCQARVVPEFQLVDAGGAHPLGTATSIKQCPDCGEVLAFT